MQVKRYAPAIGWAILIFVLSVLPGRKLPKVGLNWIEFDKVAHFGVYFLLAVAIGWSLKRGRILKAGQVVWIILICTGYGVLLEVFQHSFLSDRYFELPDMVANAAGSILGGLFVYFLFKKNVIQ